MTTDNNTSKHHDTLTFLIKCCQADPSENDIEFIHSYLHNTRSENVPEVQQLDTKALIRLANQHGILPLIYKTIKKLQPVTEMPRRHSGIDPESGSSLHIVINELKAHYQSIVQRNMLMSSELIRIMKLFGEHDIEALAFKGPTLSQTAYGDITLRQYGDLDILIQRSDISTMIDLLTVNGYTPTIDLDRSMKDTYIHALNVIGFYKSSTNTLIEVHWELLSKNYAIRWDEDALWAQKKNVAHINGTDIPMLPFDQQLLYLCVHGAKHLFERLEWVCDIDRSIRANPHIDWPYLVTKAKEMGVERMLYLGLALCQHFLRLELPEFIQDNIKHDRVLQKLISKVIKMNFSGISQEEKSYSTFGLLYNMRENLSDQLRFILYGLFAPKFDDFKSIQLPGYLAFLYPVLRPFRLVKKYMQR